MTYLRARYLNNSQGRFLTTDPWKGNYSRSLSLNRWNYSEGNPITYTDPSGRCIQFLAGGPPGAVVSVGCVIVVGAVIIVVWLTAPPVREATEKAAENVADKVDDFIDTCERIVEKRFQQPVPQPEPQPWPKGDPFIPGPQPKLNPTETPEPRRIIVELGAGNYSNAIMTKLIRHPQAKVYATNLVEEWKQGQEFAKAYRNHPPDDVAQIHTYQVYTGFYEAKKVGVSVCMFCDSPDERPYQNQDLIDLGIHGDIVYTIAPYPNFAGGAFRMGQDAALIANPQHAEIFVTTSRSSIQSFEAGFQSKYRNSHFSKEVGNPFGEPGEDWEPGPWLTWKTVVGQP